MTEDELRDLKDRTAQIVALTEQPGWMILMDRITAKLHKDQTYLIRGNCKSYDEYQKICAWMDGATYVMQAPHFVSAELEDAMGQQLEIEEQEEDG